ncbi:hypothetical protein AB0G74_05615 [Streptomyces sp. NPDC020875]|uniref:hypothetical protein n=1 Tax=Streptomyces sp. NPDC020875 TaxID=3154898 RepID=UPI00340454A3
MTIRRRTLGSGPVPRQHQEGPGRDREPGPGRPPAPAEAPESDEGPFYRPEIPLDDLRARGVLGAAPAPGGEPLRPLRAVRPRD